METYIYKGIDKQGRKQKGEVESSDRKKAMKEVKDMGVYLSDIRLKQDTAYENTLESVERKMETVFNFIFRKRRKRKQVESFKEELGKLGYSKNEINAMLNDELAESFNVDDYKDKLKLSSVQVAKIREGRLISDIKERKRGEEKLFNYSMGVPARDLLVFTQKLSLMLRSNVALLKALETSQVHFTNEKLSNAVSDVIYDVGRGNGLADSMEKHDEVFDEMYVSMVRVGETTDLSKSLSDLVDFLEMRSDYRSNMKSAMAYPSAIIFIVLGVMTVISTYLAPMMRDMFNQMDVTVPNLTLLVFFFADVWVYLLILSIATIVMLIILYLRMPGLKDKMITLRDYSALKIPKVNDMVIGLLMYQLAMTMRITLANNIDIKKSLELATKVVSNRYMKRDLGDVYFLLEQGSTLSESFSSKDIFPSDFKMSVEAGDMSGDLAMSVNEISKEYKKDLDRTMALLNSAVTYAGVIISGLIVIPVVFALFMPLIEMYQQIGSVR